MDHETEVEALRAHLSLLKEWEAAHGLRKARVIMLSGLTSEEIDAVGGITECDDD